MKKKLAFSLLFAGSFILSGCFGVSNNINNKHYDLRINDLNGGGVRTYSVLKTMTLGETVRNRGCEIEYYYDESGVHYAVDAPCTSVPSDVVLKPYYKIMEESFTWINSNDSGISMDAKLRVMTYNVLSDDWNNKPQMHGYDEHNEKYPEGVDDGRDDQNMRTILNYMPDVIGVQEFDDQWYSAMKNYYINGDFPYRVVNEAETKYTLNGSKKTIYTTLMYNEDRVTLKDWKHTRFKTADTNENCRSYTYGVFAMNDTDEEFIVISSHWNHLDSSKEDTPQREEEQAIETANVYKELRDGYGSPIIAVGDMNQLDSHPSIKTLEETSGFKDAKYTARRRGLCCDTYHIGNGSQEEPGKWYRGIESVLPALINTDEARDHIYLSDDVESIYYNTVSTVDALNSSDHMPVYVDVVF